MHTRLTSYLALIGTSKIHLSSAIFLFPVILLCLLQFFAIVLSLSTVALAINILFSTSLATYLSVVITRQFSGKITISGFQFISIILLALVSSLLFTSRLANGIPDLYCPTGILGLINQIADGHFPVSFQSFPEFPMNYHQGFVVLTAITSILFSISAVTALKILFPAFYFLLLFGVMLFLVKLQNRYYFLPPVLFFFITSAGTEIYNFLNLPVLGQISVFEFFTNNSWPLALLLITSLLFISLEFKNTKLAIFFVALLLLSLSTINALAFQTVLSTLALYCIYMLINKAILEKNFRSENFIFSCFVATIVVLLPRFIPSAFLIGEMYDSPKIVFRFFSPESLTYLEDVLNLFLLMNFLPVFILLMSICTFRKNSAPLQLLSVGLAFTIFFPIVFRFNNIIDWDMLHKFSYLSLFLSAIIFPLYLQKYRKYYVLLVAAVFVSVVISSQTIFEMISTRMTTDYISTSTPDRDSEDVISYLKGKRVTLVPYLFNDTVLHRSQKKVVFCDTYADYSAVAQFSGNFMRDTYDTNFLLNENFEIFYFKNSSWKDFDRKLSDIEEQVNSGDTFIVDKNRLDPASQSKIEDTLKANKMEFERYILYSKY